MCRLFLQVPSPLITLQKEMCSSKEATCLTLTKMRESCIEPDEIAYVDDILQKLMALEINSKAEKALEIMAQANDKVIIFTEYRATQIYLQWYFHVKGITSVLFNGKFSKK